MILTSLVYSIFLLISCDFSTETREIKQPLKITDAYLYNILDADNDDKICYSIISCDVEPLRGTGEYEITKMDTRCVISYKDTSTADLSSYIILKDYSEHLHFNDGSTSSFGSEIGQRYSEYYQKIEGDPWEGCYDFRIQLYDLNKPDKVMYETTIQEYPQLENICFEPYADDVP